jgi:Flp pilus assembly pilin Flp
MFGNGGWGYGPVRSQFQKWAVRMQLLREERGANLVEYMLLLILVAIVVVAVVAGLGIGISSKYSSAASKVP